MGVAENNGSRAGGHGAGSGGYICRNRFERGAAFLQLMLRSHVLLTSDKEDCSRLCNMSAWGGDGPNNLHATDAPAVQYQPRTITNIICITSESDHSAA